jgi:hypothetical protein
MRLTEHMRGPDCLSRLGCDQLLSGELEDRDDLRRHCASCERCAALLASHRQERASFAATLRRPRRHRRWVAGLATAAAALGLWFVVARDRGEGSGTRSKGKPAISYYWKHGDVTRKGGLGEIVFPGDAINFTASTDHPAFLTIISIDGARRASVYYPDGPVAAPLHAGRDQMLPLSVRLDDVLGLERVVGVFCDRAIPVDQLEAAVAHGTALPGGCETDGLTIEKRRAP